MRRGQRWIYIGMLLGLIVLSGLIGDVWAADYERIYDARAHHSTPTPKRTWTQKLSGGVKNLWGEPLLKKGIIGAGAGFGAAAIAEKNLMTGSVVGVGVGLGWGVLDDSKTLEHRPLLKSMSKGALAGVGASAVTGGLGALPGAAIGAGIGAVNHYVQK